MEKQGEDTDRSLSKIGEGAERTQKKATGAFGKISRGLKNLRGEAQKGVEVKVGADTSGLDEAGRGISELRRDAARGADFEVGTHTSGIAEARSEMGRVRQEASTGATFEVGADFDDGGARAEIAALKREASTADDTVHVGAEFDGGGARSGLAAFKRETATADDTVHVDADFDGGTAIAGMGAFRAAAAGLTGSLSAMDNGLSAGGVRITAFAGLAVAAASLLAPLMGALASVGSLAAAAGAGIGLIGGPIAAVVAKLTSYHQSLDAVKSAQSSADSAAQSYATAQGAVSDAQEKVAQTAAEGAAAIDKAEAAVEKARNDGTEAIEQAETDLARVRMDSAAAVQKAETDLERTREDVAFNNARAEDELEQARYDLMIASAELLDLEKELADIRDGDEERNQAQATNDLARARLDLAEARKRENEAIREYGANSLEARQAALAVRDAQIALDEQTEETNEIRAQGSEELRAAEEAWADGVRNQTAARQNLQDKEEAYNRTRLEGARAIDDAEAALARANVERNRAVGDALDAVTIAERDRTEAVAAAEADLREQRARSARAVTEAQDAVTEAQKAAEQSAADLAAAEAKVADETVALSPALMGLYNTAMRFGSAANRAFAGAMDMAARFGTGLLRDVRPAFGVLASASEASIGALSAAWDGFMQKVRMPAQQASFATILGITPEVVRSLSSAIGNIGLTLANIFAAAAPSAVRLAQYIERLTGGTLAWSRTTGAVNSVRAAIASAVPVFSALWNMVVRVGGALMRFGTQNSGAIASAIRIITSVLVGLINGFSAITRVLGPFNLVFAMLAPLVLGALMVVGSMVSGLVGLGGAVMGVVGFVGAFVTALGGLWGAITGVATVLMSGLGPTLTLIGLALSTPIGATVAVVAALAAVALVLWRNWGRVKQAFAPLVPIFNRVKATIQNLGTVLKGLFTGSTGTEQFRRAFASLPGPVQTAIKRIVIAWRGLKTGLQQAWNQVKPILAAVGNGIKKGLGSAFRFLVGQAKQLWNAMRQAWPGIRNAVLPVLSAIAKALRGAAGAAFRFFVNQAKVVVNWFRKNWPLIQRTALTVFNAIKRAVQTDLKAVWSVIKAVVGAIVRFWKANWGTIQKILSAVWKIVKTTVSTAIKAVLGIIKAVMQAITGDWKGAWDTIKGVVQTVLQAMKSNIDNVLKIIKGLLKLAWNAIKSLTSAAWDGIKKLTSAAWEAIKNYIGDKIDAARNRAKVVVSQLQAGLKAAWEAIKSAVLSAWEAVRKFITDKFDAARNRVAEIRDQLKAGLKAAWEALKSLTSAAWEAVKNSIGDKFDAARARVKQVREDMAAGLKSTWESIKGAASSAWDAIKSAIGSRVDGILEKVTNFIGSIKSAINTVLELVGLPPLGEGGGDSGGTESPGGNGSSGRGSRPVRAARRPRGYAEGGRVRERPGGVYRVAEAGEPEWVVNPNSRGYLGHLRGAAAEGGYDVVPRRTRRRPGTGRRPQPRSRRGLFPPWHAYGGDYGLYPTMHTYIPEMRKFVDEGMEKFPNTTTNTYAGHPLGYEQPYYRERSVDFWGPGGRGDPIDTDTGYAVQDWAIDRLAGDLNWLIWNGRMLTSQGWGPDTSGFDHSGHDHITGFAEGPTASGGGSGGNLKTAIFSRAWDNTVQPIVDRFLNPLKNSEFLLAQVAGAAAQKIPDGIKQWIMDKLGSAGDLGGGAGLSGTPAQNRALGEKMFPQSGLAGSFSDVDAIWTQESGWDETAQNPTSSAFGIPQFLDTTWAQYGGVSKDAEGQIRKGYAYIGDRYNGSAAEALSFKQANGWYDRGGLIRREHQAVVHPNELYLPLDSANVMQTAQTALGTAELREDFNRELRGLRQDMRDNGIRVSGYGPEAREIIVVGARQGGLGAMESGEGRRIMKGQNHATGRLSGISELVH